MAKGIDITLGVSVKTEGVVDDEMIDNAIDESCESLRQRLSDLLREEDPIVDEEVAPAVSMRKIIKSAKTYMQHQGYDVLKTWYIRDRVGLIAIDPGLDEDTLVFTFINVNDMTEGFMKNKEDLTREEAESYLIEWMKEETEKPNSSIRFDSLAFVILGEDRALIRHGLNIFGTKDRDE